jgi:tight adherence protein B
MRSWSRALRPGPRRRRHADIEREVLAVVEAVVAELRSGAPAVVALTRAVHDVPPGVLPRALDGLSGRLALDGDPTVAIDVLDEAAGTPGGEGLVALAACLRVAGATGAGLASGLTQVGADLRDDQALRAEMSAALAGPRATAKLLAGLPVFGLLLGSGIGADPVRVLLGTPAGWVCLAVGVPLQVLGWRWMERLADRADPTYWLTRASRRGERL